MVKIRSSRAFGNAERPADLPVSEPFHIVHHDHCALPVREVRERLLQPFTKLSRFRRISERHRDGLRQFLRHSYLPATDEVQCGVGHDPIQPRPEWLIRTKPVERAVRMKKPFLHRILRVLV